MSQSRESLEVVVLAAGQGTRMNSARPKVLHTLAGRPLLRHVLDTVAGLGPKRTHVVVGHGADAVREAIGSEVAWVEQTEQRGTGHAVSQALPGIGADAVVLVVYGDVPLVAGDTLAAAADAAADGALALVTATLEDPAQLGRIVRGADGAIEAIVEFKDASAEQRAIREINTGILAAPLSLLGPLLERLRPDNAQGELYLTDVVGMAVAEGARVEGLSVTDPLEITGVNDRRELAALERRLQRRLVEELMAGGVSVADPDRVDIRGRVEAACDSYIDVNVILEGDVILGRRVYLGPGAIVRNSRLDDGVRVEAYTVVEDSSIGPDCVLGPFARLRPGNELKKQVRIGNFVELKKSVLGAGTKANHLAYLGDATLGENCNVGAGTITCNYDGVDKHPTIVGDRVFLGTNSTLVAPLSIAPDAYVAAGSTITSDVRAHDLAVGRGRQRNIQGWVRPDRRKPKSEKKK